MTAENRARRLQGSLERRAGRQAVASMRTRNASYRPALVVADSRPIEVSLDRVEPIGRDSPAGLDGGRSPGMDQSAVREDGAHFNIRTVVVDGADDVTAEACQSPAHLEVHTTVRVAPSGLAYRRHPWRRPTTGPNPEASR